MYSYKKAYEEMKAEKECTIKALDEVIKTQREEIDLLKYEVTELRKRNTDLLAKRDEWLQRKRERQEQGGEQRNGQRWRKQNDTEQRQRPKLTDPDDLRHYDRNDEKDGGSNIAQND